MVEVCVKQLDTVPQRPHLCKQPLTLRQEVQPSNPSPYVVCGSGFGQRVEAGEREAVWLKATALTLHCNKILTDLVARFGNGSEPGVDPSLDW